MSNQNSPTGEDFILIDLTKEKEENEEKENKTNLIQEKEWIKYAHFREDMESHYIEEAMKFIPQINYPVGMDYNTPYLPYNSLLLDEYFRILLSSNRLSAEEFIKVDRFYGLFTKGKLFALLKFWNVIENYLEEEELSEIFNNYDQIHKKIYPLTQQIVLDNFLSFLLFLSNFLSLYWINNLSEKLNIRWPSQDELKAILKGTILKRKLKRILQKVSFSSERLRTLSIFLETLTLLKNILNKKYQNLNRRRGLPLNEEDFQSLKESIEQRILKITESLFTNRKIEIEDNLRELHQTIKKHYKEKQNITNNTQDKKKTRMFFKKIEKIEKQSSSYKETIEKEMALFCEQNYFYSFLVYILLSKER